MIFIQETLKPIIQIHRDTRFEQGAGRMKKNIIVTLIILSLFSFSACAEESDPTDSELQNTESTSKINSTEETNTMKITIGNNELTATLVNNSSTEALKAMLAKGPLSINMQDYGNMEKVGRFPQSLPRNDKSITTEAGDLILYQGNAFVIYYAPNSWNFTRLGKIDNITSQRLKEILGKGNVTVTLSLD